ncbi:MAG: SPOR domain-containing protein [Parvularculaceae bacterium]
MRQQKGQRKLSPAICGSLYRILGGLAAALALSACSALGGGDEPDLTGDSIEELNWAYASRASELETEVARLKAENARLKTRVMELERLADAETGAELTALREGEPSGLTGAAPAESADGATLSVPAPTPRRPATVVARADDAPLSSQSVPVESAPRLVQPAFASTDTVFESEADGDDIEMASVLYGVHLASYRRMRDARAGWSKLQRENPDELGLLEPRIKDVTLPEKGDFIRLIGGGFASEEKAQALCERLKQRGVFCTVTSFDGEPLTLAEAN